ncbi:MAG: MarP family serine protease [Actinobacteria bacterium]|nr:MarP family serine protease [Actinomycetota bacterium]MBW3651154.1 MarP family serine protease [Actinomycetota bacterium]
MNLLDVVVVAGAVTAALGGYRVGFLARASSWVGLAGGFYLALRLLPSLLSSFKLPTASGRLLMAITVLIVGTFIGQALGLVVGHRMRGVLPAGRARRVDRVVGAVAGAMAVVVALWLSVPTLADTPGWPARQARSSLLARAVASSLPKAPDATHAVRRLVDERGFPRVFDALQPAPDTGAPPAESGLAPDVAAAVAAATVKVIGEGEQCRRLQEGSGFVVSAGVVVTNAHVIAGVERVEVVRPDGKRLRAVVSVFDPLRDLAVLRVDQLGLKSLGRANAGPDQVGAVFGHPQGQSQARAAPARISDEVPADGRDIYDEVATRRQVFILSANLSPGDSGGALVDQRGLAVGVAFAIAPDRPGTAYALTGQELDAVMQKFNEDPEASAATGQCVD